MVETTEFNRDVKKEDLSKRRNNQVSVQEGCWSLACKLILGC